VKRILISNDDGIHAPGILALIEALEPLAEISVVAPLTEQSASSHSLTLHHPLRLREVAPRRVAVEGTPTDCVLLAVHEILEHRPDLVVSGINQGPNMGEDVLYSGTVAAAMEGAILGIPSVAVSLVSRSPRDFPAAADVTRRLVARLLEETLPARFLVNVNIPSRSGEAIRGYRATRLGTRIYDETIIRKEDPRGRAYYWIGGSEPQFTDAKGTDFRAVQEGFVSMTPLMMDLTEATQLDLLAGLDLEAP